MLYLCFKNISKIYKNITKVLDITKLVLYLRCIIALVDANINK